MMDNVVLFGDSYTAGRLPHSQVDGAFREALGVPPEQDLAVSGSTAQDWAVGLFAGKLSLVILNTASVAVGSLGGNDALQAAADGVVTDTEKVAALAALFHVLMRLRKKRLVVLMVYPDPFWGARPEAAAGHRHLAAAIRAVAGLARLAGVRVELLELEAVLKPEHFDGADIHPNAAGYAAMAAAVRRMVERGAAP